MVQALVLPLGVVCAAVMLVACSSGAGGREPDQGDQSLFDVAPVSTAGVAMHDIRFDPAAIEVVAGEVLAIEIENAGDVLHDFTLDRLPRAFAYRIEGSEAGHPSSRAVHVAFCSGQRGGVRLRFDEPGEYEFFCDVTGHRSAGMVGTISVR